MHSWPPLEQYDYVQHAVCASLFQSGFFTAALVRFRQTVLFFFSVYTLNVYLRRDNDVRNGYRPLMFILVLPAFGLDLEAFLTVEISTSIIEFVCPYFGHITRMRVVFVVIFLFA